MTDPPRARHLSPLLCAVGSYAAVVKLTLWAVHGVLDAEPSWETAATPNLTTLDQQVALIRLLIACAAWSIKSLTVP